MKGTTKVPCPYCGNECSMEPSTLKYQKNYGWLYICEPCDAYVGCHKGTTTPLGTPANRELRELRKQCHKMFDVLWLGPKRVVTRRAAYHVLAKVMGRDVKDTHIALFTKDDCLTFIDHVQKGLLQTVPNT